MTGEQRPECLCAGWSESTHFLHFTRPIFRILMAIGVLVHVPLVATDISGLFLMDISGLLSLAFWRSVAMQRRDVTVSQPRYPGICWPNVVSNIRLSELWEKKIANSDLENKKNLMSMEGNSFLIKGKFVLLLLFIAFISWWYFNLYERNIYVDRQSDMSLLI